MSNNITNKAAAAILASKATATSTSVPGDAGSDEKTITCPVCGASAHGLVVLHGEAVGCDKCMVARKADDVAEKLLPYRPDEHRGYRLGRRCEDGSYTMYDSNHGNYECPICKAVLVGYTDIVLDNDGNVIGCGGVEDYGKECSGHTYYRADSQNYSLDTAEQRVREEGDDIYLCPICHKKCETIIINDELKVIGCDDCADIDDEDREAMDASEWIMDYYDLVNEPLCGGYYRCYVKDYNAKKIEDELYDGGRRRMPIDGYDCDPFGGSLEANVWDAMRGEEGGCYD